MPTFYNISRDYEKLSDSFDVRCGDTELDVLRCDVSAAPINQVWPGYQRPFDQTEPTWYTSLGSDGEFTLTITPTKPFRDVIVRPLSKQITPVIENGSITVTFPGVGQYSVELDGRHHVLTVFANPEKDFGVSEGDGVLYFGPGVHRPGMITLEDNQTVYIDHDAVVYGGFSASGKKNIRVLGCGILDNSEVERGKGSPIGFSRCENVLVEGITVVNSAAWSIHFAGCTNVKVDNIKLIGMWRYNSDGCDFTNCTNALLTGSYLRNYDDCIVIKGLKGNRHLPVRNIQAEKCVLWCDWGRALEIGAETCAPTFRGVRFSDCDIIHGDSVMMDLQHGDIANISDIDFEDIRCEYTATADAPVLQQAPGEVYVNRNPAHMPALFVVQTVHTMWSTDDRTGNIDNVRFRDISVITEDGRIPPSRADALAADTHVKGVHFENILINGKRIDSFEALNLRIGKGVEDIDIC